MLMTLDCGTFYQSLLPIRYSSLYWVDGGGNGRDRTPKIEMSAMDGSSRTTLFSGRSLGMPRAMAVDHELGEEGGRIYWTDDQRGRIESATLDGSDRERVAGMYIPTSAFLYIRDNSVLNVSSGHKRLRARKGYR